MGPVGDWAGATVGSPYARRQNVSRTQKAPLLNLAIHDLILLSFSMFDFLLSGLAMSTNAISASPFCVCVGLVTVHVVFLNQQYTGIFFICPIAIA